MLMKFTQKIYDNAALTIGDTISPAFRLDGPPKDTDNDVQEFLVLVIFTNSEADGGIQAVEELSGENVDWHQGIHLDDGGLDFTGLGPHYASAPLFPMQDNSGIETPFSVALSYFRVNIAVTDGVSPNTASAKVFLVSNKSFTATQMP